MPARSEKQRRLMMADLARAKAGKRTRTGMSASQLEDFKHMAKKSKKPRSYLPPGVAQTPRGDIGAHRQMEGVRVGGFDDGTTIRAAEALPYRPCKEAKDPAIPSRG